MTHILPWVALALAAAALLAREGSREPAGTGPTPLWNELRSNLSLLIALGVLGAVAVAFGWGWKSGLNGALASSLGVILGLALAKIAWIAELGQARAIAGATVPAALGLGAVGLTVFAAPGDRPNVFMGLLAGCALGGWLLSLARESSGSWPGLACVFAAAAGAANHLGMAGQGDKADETGLAFGAVAVLAGLAGVGFSRAIEKQRGEDGARAGLFVVIATALLLLGGSLVAQRYLFIEDTWQLFGGAVVAALIVNWLLPDGKRGGTLRFLIAAVVWISLATIAFGLRKGYGMSVTLIGSMSMLILLGNRRALMSLGPVIALVMFRVFTDSHPDAYRAIDIGQHYALIGVLLGAALPLLPIEWARALPADASKSGMAVAGTLWALLLLGVMPAAAVLLGAKGVVGFLVGLGFSAVIEGFHQRGSLQALSLTAGLSAAGAVTYGWLGDHLDKPRNEKVWVLYYIGGALLVMAILIATLTPKEEETIHESAA